MTVSNKFLIIDYLPLKNISGGKTSIGSGVFPKWFIVVQFKTGSGYLCNIEYLFDAYFFSILSNSNFQIYIYNSNL